jgi:hypothetical protein
VNAVLSKDQCITLCREFVTADNLTDFAACEKNNSETPDNVERCALLCEIERGRISLYAKEEIKDDHHANRGNHEIGIHRDIDPITFRDFDRFQGFEHTPVLHDRTEFHNRTQQNETNADPERGIPLPLFALNRHKHMKEETEALDNEAEAHQGNAGAGPCQERPLGCEKYSWII